MPKSYAYIRVSTREQEIHRQVRAMEALRIPRQRIYIDKVSGKNFDRPAWRKLRRKLRSGDLLYVKSIDRFGRCYEDIIREWRHITKTIDAHIIVIDMPLLDTTQMGGFFSGFIADLVLQLLSFIADFERRLIRQRQREGIQAAHDRGVVFGRPRRNMDSAFYESYALWQRGELSLRQAALRCGVPFSTFRDWCGRMKSE